MTFIVTVTSSIYTGGITGIIDELGCSLAIATSGLTVFVLGYGVGPIVSHPNTLLTMYMVQSANIDSFGDHCLKCLPLEEI